MAYGIGQEIDNLKSIGAARLTKSQAENPDLFTALALQQLTSEQAAAGRQQSMNPQPALPQGNLIQQMGAELSQTMPQSPVDRLAPGIQQQGQRSMQQPQPQQRPQMGGISGVPANNMGAIGRAGGGIIEYAKGGSIPVGNSNQPIPMLMEKYGAEKVTQFIAEKKALDAKARALAEAGPAAGSMRIEDHKLMKEIFSEKYRDILNESMGMARGGVVGYAPGGRIKRFQGLEGSEVKESGGLHPFSFVNWALGKGIDLTVLGAQEVAALAAEFSNTEVGQNQRSILSQVGRGAMGAIADVVPDTAMSQGQIGAREAQLESGRGGIGAILSRNNSGPSVTDQLLAAEQRRTEAPLTGEERAQRDKYNPVAYQQRRREQEMGRRDPNYGQQEEGIASVLPNQEKGSSFYDRTKGYMPDVGNIMQGVSENIGDFVDESGLADLDYERFARGVLPRATEVALNSPDPSLGRYFGAFGNDVVAGLGRLKDVTLGPDFVSDLQEGYLGEEPGARTPTEAEEVAEDIQQIDAITDANGVPTESVVARLPSVRAGDLDAVVGSSATTPVASSATTPVSGFTADQTDRFGKMMQGAKDENFLNEYVGTISPNGDAGTGAATQKTGIAGLLQKVKPYADKASGIAKILGRGAGASEGFEFSQIAQKSAARDAEDRLAARNAEIADKLFSRQTQRDTAGFEQQKTLEDMGIEASMDELTYRVDKAAELAGTELTAQMRTDLVVAMQSDIELLNALETLKDDYTTGAGYFDGKERFDAEGYNRAAFKLRDEWLAGQMRLIRPGQTPTAPATERYSVL